MLAVITGASSGIGEELARQLAKNKYDLVLIARRTTRLEEIKKQLEQYQISIEVYTYDLEKQIDLEDLTSKLDQYEIDLFINNAGFGIVGNSFEVSTDRELSMIDLNIKSLHYLSAYAIKKIKNGQLINISSLVVFLPTSLLVSYAATKAYVYSYSTALRYELKKKGIPINVMTVCPGPVKTEFGKVANATQKMKGQKVDKCVNEIIKGIKRKKALVIPGFSMKILYILLKVMPLSLILKSAYKIQSKK